MNMTSRSVCLNFVWGSCPFGRHCRQSHDLRGTPNQHHDEDILPAVYTIEAVLPPVLVPSPIPVIPRIDDGETIGELSIGTLSNLVRRPRPVSIGSLAQRHPSSSTPVQQISQNDNDLKSSYMSSSLKTYVNNNNGENRFRVEHTFLDRCIENELQCNICQEIYIKPTVLNCSHTFCHVCIESWTRIKNRCPLCRVKVLHKTYCRSLDTFLEKITPCSSEETQLKRKSRIEEHNVTHN